MAKDPTNSGQQPAAMAQDEIRRLAQDAIRRLAADKLEAEDPMRRRLSYLYDAYLSDDSNARHVAMDRLRNEGASNADIVDTIIPEVARIMGQHWADDILSFAEVTIGTARLQETVRSLSRSELSSQVGTLSVHLDDSSPSKVDRILLVIPRPEHHTLGTFVAADMLRRFGYAVDISVDQSAQQVALMVRKQRYAMVGITAAGRRSLASARELVEKIRGSVTRVTPIIVGGSLVGSDLDLKGITGADYVTNDIRAALELCGLDNAETEPVQGEEVSRAD